MFVVYIQLWGEGEVTDYDSKGLHFSMYKVKDTSVLQAILGTSFH